MLSPSGLFLTAAIHTSSTLFLAAKILGAMDLLETGDLDGEEFHGCVLAHGNLEGREADGKERGRRG